MSNKGTVIVIGAGLSGKVVEKYILKNVVFALFN